VKIKRVDLRDFRQFHGHEHIEFATDDTRNVTLVHAENGVGKTTLLNAVFWALYNRTTPRFEQRSRLVNFET
ncbi:AAA family ATPase, partial [Serratia marcescens]|uniref:AAA family ATPase n=1 Tax=Serratia marcescens TaxID=615 RepID=UPI0019546223